MGRTTKHNRWLTPTDDGGGDVCRPLLIPSVFLPIVSTLLELLADDFRWETDGAYTPAECAALMRTMLDNYYTGDCMTASAMQQFSAFWWELQKNIGNALTPTLNSVQEFGIYWHQTTAAINDEMAINVLLDGGTYTLDMLGIQASSAGIITLYVDDVSQGTLDTYHVGSNVLNVTFTLTGIVIVGGGNHELRFAVPTKNAASSSYNILMTLFRIYRTGD